MSRSATPTQTALMWRRPRSSTFIAVLKPCPSRSGPPMIASGGTRTSSKITSQVCAPFWPIFLSGAPSVIPGLSASTRKAETPRASLLCGSVRAKTVKSPAAGALVMKRLAPLIT
jgi:hypothetical protein